MATNPKHSAKKTKILKEIEIGLKEVKEIREGKRKAHTMAELLGQNKS